MATAKLQKAGVGGQAIGNQFWFAVVGGTLLAASSFAPVISVPIVGSLTPMNGDARAGAVLLLLATVALVAAFLRRYNWSAIAGALALCGLCVVIVRYQQKLAGSANASTAMERVVNEAAKTFVRYEFGLLLLAVGAVLLISSADWFRRVRARPAISGRLRLGAAVAVLIVACVGAGSYWYEAWRSGSPGDLRRRESELVAAVTKLARYQVQRAASGQKFDTDDGVRVRLRDSVSHHVRYRTTVVSHPSGTWEFEFFAEQTTGHAQQCVEWILGANARKEQFSIKLDDYAIPPNRLMCTSADGGPPSSRPDVSGMGLSE